MGTDGTFLSHTICDWFEFWALVDDSPLIHGAKNGL